MAFLIGCLKAFNDGHTTVLVPLLISPHQVEGCPVAFWEVAEHLAKGPAMVTRLSKTFSILLFPPTF